MYNAMTVTQIVTRAYLRQLLRLTASTRFCDALEIKLEWSCRCYLADL